MFALKFAAQLPTVVRQELEQLVSDLRAYLLTEHNDDGSHSAINATDAILTPTGLGTFGGQHRAFLKASAVTLTTDTETVLAWATPAIDGAADRIPDNGWNVGPLFSASEPTRLRAKIDGTYLFSYAIRFADNATGTRYAFLNTGGYGSTADFAQCRHGANANGNVVGEAFVLPMRAGQFVQLSAYQSSGGDLAITTGFLNSWIQMTRLG